MQWLLAPKLSIHPRDDAGLSDLFRRKGRAIMLAAEAASQSVEHIISFCEVLHRELAFYVGCLNLYEELTRKGEEICFPVPHSMEDLTHTFSDLYDISLSLSLPDRIVGNCADMGERMLALITGANHGGKSTFLRSIGQAQLMMECGMFVPAKAFAANITSGIFTHYKREEDSSMERGKLDEELHRMSLIIDEIQPWGMVLFNESFASTNEREGAEIARQILRGLLDENIKVFFVTHMHDLSSSLMKRYGKEILSLCAERRPDGSRSFRLIEGTPLSTSFGEDIYQKVFGEEIEAAEEEAVAEEREMI